MLRYAPAAAELATSLGAHREAAAQYARALRFADGLPLGRRGELLELRSSACFLTGQFEEALEAQAGALESHRSLGDRRKEGEPRALWRLLRYVGRIEEAWDAGRAAVEVLESLPAGRELALAYCNLSGTSSRARRTPRARWAGVPGRSSWRSASTRWSRSSTR